MPKFKYSNATIWVIFEQCVCISKVHFWSIYESKSEFLPWKNFLGWLTFYRLGCAEFYRYQKSKVSFVKINFCDKKWTINKAKGKSMILGSHRKPQGYLRDVQLQFNCFDPDFERSENWVCVTSLQNCNFSCNCKRLKPKDLQR